jgi:hypothetical protein
MSVCSSCGGVVGRECLDPAECAWIEQQQQQQQAHNNNDCRIAALEQAVSELFSELQAIGSQLAELDDKGISG